MNHCKIPVGVSEVQLDKGHDAEHQAAANPHCPVSTTALAQLYPLAQTKLSLVQGRTWTDR